MGLSYRRSFRVGSRSRLNLSGSGASLTRRQGPVTFNSRGRVTVRLGKGLRYTFRLFGGRRR